MAAYRRRRTIRRRTGGRRVARKRSGRRRLMASGSYTVPRPTPATQPLSIALKRKALKNARAYPGLRRVKRRINFNENVGIRRVAGVTRVRGTQEVSRFSSAIGRKINNVNKLIRVEVPNRILRFQGMNTTEQNVVQRGYYIMENGISNATQSGNLPMYVLSLNNTVQNSINTACFFQCSINSTGRVIFTGQNGTRPNAAANSTFLTNILQTESDSIGALDTHDFRHIVNEWQQVKLAMFGARHQQTTFHVELIQCNKDYAGIEEEPDLATGVGTLFEPFRDEVYQYWQNKAKKLVSASIADVNVACRRNVVPPYRSIRKWRFDVKPVDIGEADASPNMLIANLLINDGRICDYQWVRQATAFDATNLTNANGVDDALVNPNWYGRDVQAVSTGLRSIPAPKARRYLIISAQQMIEGANNSVAVGEGNETVELSRPSFDLVYRKRERVGRNNAV